ncbi:hypothetical protein OUZ56_013726 [Daphnia magna]|uniref:Uncharacterized protein n=1 Tax=Daphnia magna TaxID=35525 RepID=A0ABQ9Z6R6_9CRUS|nr:hypothetical protein OUZ56_013726 [Daphnia magna]
MREYHVLSAMVAEAPRNLGRRISRRLSMSVAKVPTFIQSKFRTDVDVADFSSSGGAGGGVANNNGQWWPQQLRRSRPVTLHIILPNGIERTNLIQQFEVWEGKIYPPLKWRSSQSKSLVQYLNVSFLKIGSWNLVQFLVSSSSVSSSVLPSDVQGPS